MQWNHRNLTRNVSSPIAVIEVWDKSSTARRLNAAKNGRQSSVRAQPRRSNLSSDFTISPCASIATELSSTAGDRLMARDLMFVHAAIRFTCWLQKFAHRRMFSSVREDILSAMLIGVSGQKKKKTTYQQVALQDWLCNTRMTIVGGLESSIEPPDQLR